MHYTGAEWLTRDNREQEERCSLMLTNLGVKRGMTICDMGCGNGFYTLQLAKMTGDDGHVYAVDIQPEMLKLLNQRADEQGVRNISPILGTLTDPALPKGKIDLILLVDVYHEFSHPEQMLAAMREALSPDGRLRSGRIPRRRPERADQARAQDDQRADHERMAAQRLQARQRIRRPPLAASHVLRPR